MKDNKDDKIYNKVRKIEFRGKAVTPCLLKLSEREWHYGSLVSKYDADAGDYCEYHILEKFEYSRTVDYDSDLYNVDFYEVDENTLGQFTGRCDKNGKKIYEGDILRLPAYLFDGETCVCVYQGTDTGIGFELIESRRYCLDYDGRILSDEWEDFEVIGNIYDNPELLGGSDEECDN